MYSKNLLLSSDIRVTRLFAELNEMQWNIVFINESRAKNGIFVLDGGHILFCELSNYAASGCAILIHVTWRDAVRKIILRRLGRLTAIDIKFEFRVYRYMFSMINLSNSDYF